MASFDLIVKSLQESWTAGGSGNTSLIPTAKFYYDRAQQPSGVGDFPFAEIHLDESEPEVTSSPGTGRLIQYELEIKVWTCQGQTGGATSGDQMTDQGTLMRALESLFQSLTPNAAWNYIPLFKHAIEMPSTLHKDTQIYQGADVYISTNTWQLLVGEL